MVQKAHSLIQDELAMLFVQQAPPLRFNQDASCPHLNVYFRCTMGKTPMSAARNVGSAEYNEEGLA